MRVVTVVLPWPQQDEAREAAGHRHRLEHRLGHGRPLGPVETGRPAADHPRVEAGPDPADDARVEPVEMGMRYRPGEPGGVADDLGGEAEPGCFHIGEGGYRR